MAAQTHSRIGVMINNAGVMPSSPLERLRTDEWNQMIDVTVASTLGEPDAGLASYRDMVERVRAFCDKSDTPMICDADTGYGGLLNVAHTVRGYEAAGAAGIQLEDQEFPKKCGHNTPGRRVIVMDDMVHKIQVAVESRYNEDTLIIARTDARTALGLDEALRRGLRRGWC